MADITQSATPVSLLDHQEITHAGNVLGTAADVSSWLSALITVWLANIETTANATAVSVKIQGSQVASGDAEWFDLVTFTGSTTAAETEVLTATEPVGETVLAMASTTNLAVGDIVYIKDDTSVATSEWHEIVAVAANTSITIADGLAVEKVADDDVYDQASRFVCPINCEGLKRIRVVVIHQAATGSDIRVKAQMIGATDIE